MKFTEKKIDDFLIVIVNEEMIGEIESHELYGRIKKLPERGYIKCVFDFSGVKWITGSGLGMLFAIKNTIIENKGKIKLVGITNNIQSLLTITQLMHFFEIFENIELAISSFNE